MLSVVVLGVIKLSVIMLSVVVLNVVAPFFGQFGQIEFLLGIKFDPSKKFKNAKKKSFWPGHHF